jgi:thermostable 8-oxoguanine DNA glycosylase
MSELDELIEYYDKHKQEMKEFLQECSDRGKSGDAVELFKWLCKNLLASQAEWEKSSETVEYLIKSNCLDNGSPILIENGLRLSGYRSPNNKKKAEWIFKARQLLYDKGSEIGIVDFVHLLGFKCGEDSLKLRNLLADTTRDNHISGLGMKEASHFLRGLGFSHNKLAILDSVVLRKLVYLGVINNSPNNLPRNTYLAIENRVKDWADNIICIPLDGLDWLLWRIGRNDSKKC